MSCLSGGVTADIEGDIYEGHQEMPNQKCQTNKIAEAFGCRLWLKEVHLYSCLFVSIRVSILYQ